MTDDIFCCGNIEELHKKGYSFGIRMATLTNIKTMKMSARMVIDIFKETTNGMVSQAQKNKSYIRVAFCPFCGKSTDREKGDKK